MSAPKPMLPALFRFRRWHKYESDAARHWDQVWADHWSGKSYDSLLAEARSSTQAPFLLEHLPPRGVVLEAGCGHGQWLVALAADGRLLVGLDRYPGPMRRTHAEHPELAFAQGDVLKLPFRDGSVAAVLSFGVLEHFEAGFGPPLDEVRRVLAPDGVLLVSVPYYSVVRRLVEPFRLLRERLRESPALRKLLRQAPLPPKRFYQYAYTTGEFAARLRTGGFAGDAVIYYDTAFGLTRDYPVMRAFRRRLPWAFRALDRFLRALSPRIAAHMQMHAVRKISSGPPAR